LEISENGRALAGKTGHRARRVLGLVSPSALPYRELVYQQRDGVPCFRGPVCRRVPYPVQEGPRKHATPGDPSCGNTVAASPPLHPALFQFNTRVVLQETSSALGRSATLDDLPDAILDRAATLGFDW